MKAPLLLLSLFVVAAASVADEWGDWDDLPDNLLTPEPDTEAAINELYQKLSSNDLNNQAAFEEWLSRLQLEFVSDEDWQDLINDLQGESQEETIEELQEWLDDEADDISDDLEDSLDEFEDEEEDRLDEQEDELDDMLDEQDEVDEVDEIDDPETEEVDDL